MKLVSTLAAGVIAVLATLAVARDAKASACAQSVQYVYHCEPYYAPSPRVMRHYAWRPRKVLPRPVVRPVVHRAVYRAPPVVHMCCVNNVWVRCSDGTFANEYVSTASLGRWAE